MGTTAVFGQATFGQAVFGNAGAESAYCLADTYSTLASYHTGIESVPDTKFLGAFSYREGRTLLTKIIQVRKT